MIPSDYSVKNQFLAQQREARCQETAIFQGLIPVEKGKKDLALMG
jgi:hypothetical protein